MVGPRAGEAEQPSAPVDTPDELFVGPDGHSGVADCGRVGVSRASSRMGGLLGQEGDRQRGVRELDEGNRFGHAGWVRRVGFGHGPAAAADWGGGARALGGPVRRR